MTRRRRHQHSTAQRTFSLDDYRANPAQFIAEILIDPETRKPFELCQPSVPSLIAPSSPTRAGA
jgi:hypothetical protein